MEKRDPVGKKPYETPKLWVYGDLRKMTKTTGAAGITDSPSMTGKTS
jgi:hypothetical protein